jgi:hypothetical protein
MVIQVRSDPESQEWEVIVEPSTEASLPTRTLVQEPLSGRRSRARQERQGQKSQAEDDEG